MVFMSSPLVLVVDDEPAIREMVAFALGEAEFRVEEAQDAVQARKRMSDNLPDLILLDWMLPGMSGIELARWMRKNDATRRLPIIMLTAKSEEIDKLKGLEVGADDYVTKPFSTRELLARIKAVLRRSVPYADEDQVDVAGLKLDPGTHRVTAGDHVVHLGPTEFKLLHFFMTHPERVYSRAQLLDQIWGDNVYVEERTVDVHIRRLRKALSETGFDRFIQTVRGAGYRFSGQ
jgi:two-component system phosphate regulon response regulator PhoB